MTVNQHAVQFHGYLVAAGVRPAHSRADDYTDEAKADPHWRRPTAEPVASPPPVEVGLQRAEPSPDADWNLTRADLK